MAETRTSCRFLVGKSKERPEGPKRRRKDNIKKGFKGIEYKDVN
jgi:hypothetical protein